LQALAVERGVTLSDLTAEIVGAALATDDAAPAHAPQVKKAKAAKAGRR
jgi:hypothetical protein